jgi:hypothetical protein
MMYPVTTTSIPAKRRVSPMPACGVLDRQSFKVRISSFNSGAVRVAHKAVIQAHVEEAFAAGTAG